MDILKINENLENRIADTIQKYGHNFMEHKTPNSFDSHYVHFGLYDEIELKCYGDLVYKPSRESLKQNTS